MKILLIEPFFTGSHRQWAEALQQNSSHQIEILSLSGHHWKWRMHGGAITLAQQFLSSLEARNTPPDLILASDMLDLTTFLSLTRKQTATIPTAIYFHENQLTYPWSPKDKDVALKRDNHYAFINYTSALAADALFFNSEYHQNSFLNALPDFLKQFPDHQTLAGVEALSAKSQVLHLGMDLQKIRDLKPAEIPVHKRAVILWNHRWEYDKNPEDFFQALFTLADRGIDYRLIVLGESFPKSPAIFKEAQTRLADKILHFAYADSYENYVHWLYQGDILPVTSKQDFFGGSIIEAMAADVVPLLPKRLAYPEHIPKAYHPVYFYESDKEYLKRLQGLIFNANVIRKQNNHQHVMKYDWQNLIPMYDDAFTNVKNHKKM